MKILLKCVQWKISEENKFIDFIYIYIYIHILNYGQGLIKNFVRISVYKYISSP